MGKRTADPLEIKVPAFEMTGLTSPLPEFAEEYFTAQSKKFVLPEHVVGIDGFQELNVLRDGSGLITYVGVERKVYDTNHAEEILVYLLETENDHEAVGYGEIRLGQTDDTYFKDKPFVGFTRTEERYQRNGLGTRRLFAMDYLTRILFDLRLNSSTTIQQEAESIWKKVVAHGYAVSYDEEGRVRYHFT